MHIDPETAVPVSGIPVADVVTRANVQHAAWELVRSGKTVTARVILPLAELIATQQVVNPARVAEHEARLRAIGKGATFPPLVLPWDGDKFLIDGHHRMQARHNLGLEDASVDVLIGE
jgi:hypothetical protein